MFLYLLPSPRGNHWDRIPPAAHPHPQLMAGTLLRSLAGPGGCTAPKLLQSTEFEGGVVLFGSQPPSQWIGIQIVCRLLVPVRIGTVKKTFPRIRQKSKYLSEKGALPFPSLLPNNNHIVKVGKRKMTALETSLTFLVLLMM